MTDPSGETLAHQVLIRSFDPGDQAAVSRLYTQGLLAGQIPDNDTGADIENIAEAYLDPDRAGFWVAEFEGQVVGMVGVAEDEPNVAEIRRLRVDPDRQNHGIGMRLMETALGFCRHHGYLKVRLDTRLEKGQATELFDRFAFQHHRTRDVPGKEVLEFYLDLYREPKSDEE
jgi:putative acetyltransferase